MVDANENICRWVRRVSKWKPTEKLFIIKAAAAATKNKLLYKLKQRPSIMQTLITNEIPKRLNEANF